MDYTLLLSTSIVTHTRGDSRRLMKNYHLLVVKHYVRELRYKFLEEIA